MILKAVQLTVILALSAGSAVPQEEKPAFPAETTREKTTKQLKALYEGEYSKTGSEARRKFAQSLLDEARRTTDPALLCVLLIESRDIAAKSGKVDLAFEAINRIVGEFDLRSAGPDWTANAQKLAVIEEAKGAVRGKAELATLTRVCLDLTREGLDSGHFDMAANAATIAERLARAARDLGMTREARDLKKEVDVFQKEFKGLEAAELKLSVTPDDPDANLTVGRFTCFFKGDWANGVPCLAKGNDSGLKAVADMELSSPQEAKGQADIGDAWVDLSQSERGQISKERCLERASFWYEKALGGAKGILRLGIEKKLKGLPKPKTEAGANIFAFTTERSLNAFNIEGDVVIAKGGGLECLPGLPRSIAVSKAEFTGPIRVEFELLCAPDGLCTVFPGVYGHTQLKGVSLLWGVDNNTASNMIIFGKRKRIDHLKLEANRVYKVVINIDGERKVTVLIDGKTMFTGILNPDAPLEGPIILSGGVGHAIYKKVTVQGTRKQ